MLFWIIVVAIAAVVAIMLLLPLWRSAPAVQEDRNDMTIYKDQLAEVERDLARGVLNAEEAERTRTEIARRLLAADQAEQSATPKAPRTAAMTMSAIAFGLLIAGTAYGYWSLGAPGYPDMPQKARIEFGREMRENRISQEEAESLIDQSAFPPVEAPQDYIDMVAQLREIVPTRPDDLQGWALLARHEAALGNYVAARVAQQELVTRKGADATQGELTTLADLMVGAANGFVSPEAETVLRTLVDRDPDDIAARYYFGLLYGQTDRPDLAFRLWREVVESGSDAPYVEWARSQIMEAAQLAGADYELPSLRGPTQDQINDAAGMDAESQAAMIQGMVDGLSERLATEGGSAAEWAQLISALGVLGQTDRAAAIWGEAQQVFSGRDDALAQIRNAAISAGVAE